MHKCNRREEWTDTDQTDQDKIVRGLLSFLNILNVWAVWELDRESPVECQSMLMLLLLNVPSFDLHHDVSWCRRCHSVISFISPFHSSSLGISCFVSLIVFRSFIRSRSFMTRTGMTYLLLEQIQTYNAHRNAPTNCPNLQWHNTMYICLSLATNMTHQHDRHRRVHPLTESYPPPLLPSSLTPSWNLRQELLSCSETPLPTL
jgi:hypothetical protein